MTDEEKWENRSYGQRIRRGHSEHQLDKRPKYDETDITGQSARSRAQARAIREKAMLANRREATKHARPGKTSR